MMSARSFAARIVKVGINPCVEVPPEIGNAFQRRGFIPVLGSINGVSYRATLVPRGRGHYRLYLNGEIRRATTTDVGNVVKVRLKLDTASRDIRPPSDFAAALRAESVAQTAFRAASPSRRRELLRWILGAKKPETRRSRIERAIARLSAR